MISARMLAWRVARVAAWASLNLDMVGGTPIGAVLVWCGCEWAGSAEAPTVVGVEQVREPGHAPFQVGPHPMGWVRHGRPLSACDSRPRTARPGRIGWQVLLMLARAAGCARGD